MRPTIHRCNSAAHDAAAERVEQDGQVHVARRGGVLGHVHHPQPVRLGRVGVPVHEIVARIAAIAAGAAVSSTAVDALHAGLAHEPLDALA